MIEVIKATNLRASDSWSKSSDPYVRLVLDDGRDFKSKTVKRSTSPIWNEPLMLTFENREACNKATLKCQVLDQDMFTRDDSLGSVNIPNLGTTNGVLHLTLDSGAKIWLRVLNCCSVVVNIVMAQGLLACDSKGFLGKKTSSDPYVHFIFCVYEGGVERGTSHTFNVL